MLMDQQHDPACRFFDSQASTTKRGQLIRRQRDRDDLDDGISCSCQRGNGR
jgi:hypothetical protein